MSDSGKDQSFKTASWGPAKSGGTGNAGAGNGFKSLYSEQGKEDAGDGFVVSFVGKETAQRLSAAQARKKPAPAAAAAPEAPPPEELEEIRRRAHDEGFSQGHEAGMAEGRRQSRETIERMADIVAQIESAWRDLIQAHEARIIDLVTRAVEKVVYGQAATDQEMVKRTIIEALRVVPEPVNVQISVNPKDYDYIETVKADFFTRIPALKDVSVTPDPAIHPGGCNIRTKFGEVDATLESRLDAIRECLLKANGTKVVSK